MGIAHAFALVLPLLFQCCFFVDSADSSGGSRVNSAGVPRRSIADLSDTTGPKKPVDASYSDPLGPAIERPKTAARQRVDEDFDDFEVDDNLLPD